jgi:hypothetical protein
VNGTIIKKRINNYKSLLSNTFAGLVLLTGRLLGVVGMTKIPLFMRLENELTNVCMSAVGATAGGDLLFGALSVNNTRTQNSMTKTADIIGSLNSLQNPNKVLGLAKTILSLNK